MNASEIALLFELHGPKVYRRALRLLGNRSDAEEATQEVFVRVLRGVEGFEHQSLMTTWLYRITTNYCLNVIRDRARRAELYAEHVAPMAHDGDAAMPARSDDLCLVRRLFEGADDQQAMAVIYVHLDGMSHDEAAQLLGVSRRTVGNLLERFRARANDEPQTVADDDAPPSSRVRARAGASLRAAAA